MSVKDQRVCPGCGGARYRKAALCRRCHSEARRGKPRVETPAHRNTGHARARVLYPLGPCEYEGCKAPARDRHHVDGNTTNNAPENVAIYCRRHHMLVDGRLDRLRSQARSAGLKGGRPRKAARA